MCPPLSVLQEIEKIRQQSTHEGVHKDGLDYRSKIEAATKDYMPLSVSTISIDITTSLFPISWVNGVVVDHEESSCCFTLLC